MNISQEAIRTFRLSANPFQGDIQSGKDVYYSVEHLYVKNTLEQAARLQGCLIAVVGEVGSGKTTVKNNFIEEAEAKGVKIIQPFMLDKSKLSVQHVEEALVYGLDPQAKLFRSREARNRQLTKLLQESTKAGRKHVLVVEEAQDLPTIVLKVLKRLVEIKVGNKSCISIVMIGQPELLARLDASRNYHLRELINRTTVAQLQPFDDSKDVRDYLALKFGRGAKVFSFDAYEGILEALSEARSGRRVSAAYPLSINNLVIEALNQAAELGLETISAELIRGLRRGLVA